MPSSNSARYHDRALSDLGEAAYAAVTCFLICLRVHTEFEQRLVALIPPFSGRSRVHQATNDAECPLGCDSGTTDQQGSASMSGITTATSVATGDSHSCALLANGSVQCWGDNDNGQLGLGFFSPRPRANGKGAAPGRITEQVLPAYM